MKLTSARLLYRKLKITEPYDTWAMNNVKNNDKFVKNVDYRVKRGNPINHHICCNRVDLELREVVVEYLKMKKSTKLKNYRF